MKYIKLFEQLNAESLFNVGDIVYYSGAHKNGWYTVKKNRQNYNV